MALFMKQDFSPPILSKKWIATKFRANMLIYSHRHILDILESGLLFREDSVEVEQEAPSPEVVWGRAGGGAGGWLTAGERNTAIVGVVACVLAAPPRSVNKSTIAYLTSLLLIPAVIRTLHRARCAGSLRKLLELMRNYMTLARRATACCREYAALHAQLGSVASAIESTHAMLYRQQKELLVLMSRATSALLGNAPWIKGDITVECDTDSLMKIHHAFLVVQSSLLKYIALAHYMPSHAQKLYKNHNERIHWIHHTLIDNLITEFRDNYDSLERMYRLLKNYGTKDNDAIKKPGFALKETWLYSDVHTGVARSCLELKLALNKCNDLDMFLDSCALNKQEIDLTVLNKDIDAIIDDVTKCLNTIQSSQIRLKKMQNKLKKEDEIEKFEEEVEDAGILKIEAKEPEIRDEVFYFVKTEDDDSVQPVADVVTAPGKKEKETTKIVLNELRRKLVKREDLMRERERQALAKTMPELENVPEFERQISLQDFVDRKGFLSKVPRKQRKKSKLSKSKNKKCKNKYRLKICKYVDEADIKDSFYEANAKLAVKSRLVSVNRDKYGYVINKWMKNNALNNFNINNNGLDSSGLSDGLSDVESDAVNINVKTNNEALNYKFSKKDLELTPSSSDSEFEIQNNALLNDIRRYRAVRKKNFPAKRRSIDKDMDESMKPIEYRFGTGMAMASVLQLNSRRFNMAEEEVFVGNGEVSEDSGNDEDA